MKSSRHLVARLAATVRRRLWQATRGFGKPVPLETWEQEYRAGAWDYLSNLEELAHYMMIVGYATQAVAQPDILDVGCGSGHLLRWLPPSGFRSYLGVDFSPEAIARASQWQAEGAQFVRGDFETWVPPQAVDVIVFNESLYYSRRPGELVARYARHLRANGKIIVSMFQASGHRFIWKSLDSVLLRIDGVQIARDDGRRWQVALFAPRPA